MDKTFTVYIHITPSNKAYVGITSQSVKKRWNNGLGYIKNKHFYRAILRYGWDNIQHNIIATELDEEQAKCLEMELIQKYNSADIRYGYNITKGGDTRVITAETRAKISKANKGKPKSEHMRKALSEARKRMIYPKLTDEHKRKISKSLYGNRRAAGGTWNRKPVVQKELGGAVVRYFTSAQEVKDIYGFDHSSICKCCNENKKRIKGKYNGRYKGYIWEFVDPEAWANKLGGVEE